jgi:hypothetical protein
MRIWARFFVGTPVRFIATALVVAALAAVSKIWPGLIQSSLYQLAKELSPILQLGLTLVVIGIGFAIIAKGLRR